MKKILFGALFSLVSISAFARWPIEDCDAFSEVLESAWDGGNGDDRVYEDLLAIFDDNC